MDLRHAFLQRHEEILVPTAAKLENYLKKVLPWPDGINVDQISVRAKAVDSFTKKANKVKDGAPKYTDPINQIQDQIGARIVVFFKQDAEAACELVKQYFATIEEIHYVPDEPTAFDYEGEHFVCLTPDDIYENDEEAEQKPEFFEMQVKTLFQHAWSQANHDLIYKAPVPITNDHRRRVAYTAAQAWGADQMFKELRDELIPPTEAPS